jgi:hypothetical protein
MLSMQVNNDRLFAEQNAQDEIDVARPAIKLTPIAYILEEVEGPRFQGRNAASLYYTPDQQQIIRLPSSWSKKFHEYDQARIVPETHPVWNALRDQNRKTDEPIRIRQSDEGDIGKFADPALIKWFEEILEPQLQEGYAELRKAHGLEP